MRVPRMAPVSPSGEHNTAGASSSDDDSGGEEAQVNVVLPIRDAEHRLISLLYPVEGMVDCSACRAQGGVSTFLEAKDMVKHATTAHPKSRLTIVCRGCNREFPGLNNVRSHKPRCKGPAAPETGDHPCTECDRRFQTQRGLSQHEIKAHPDRRNQARKEQSAPAKPAPRKGVARAWSEEEVELLEVLELRFANEVNVNKKLEEYFPHKTNRQIRDKRSDLRRKAARWRDKDRCVEAEAGASADHPQGIRTRSNVDLNDHNIDNSNFIYNPGQNGPGSMQACTEDERAWRVCLAASAIRTFFKNKDKLRGGHLTIGCRLAVVAQKVREGGPITPELTETLDSIIETLTSLIAKQQPGNRPAIERKHGKGKKNNRSARRKRNYAHAQYLAEHNMKALAEIVAQDNLEQLVEQPHSPPDDEDVRALYDSLWGRSEETSFPPTWESNTVELSPIVAIPPIQLEAVIRRHKLLKKKTATGLDGIGKTDLTSEALVNLTLVYNLCLATEFYPVSWRTNRTTLIPKAGKDHNLATSWRPITIGSVVGRLFSGIIDTSLRENVKFNYRQKGFTTENGTHNNVALLQQAMHNMKKGEGGVCSILDISKAFDTVPHGALVPALQRLGLPRIIASYVLRMYEGCRTKIKARNGEVDISLIRGVKQGDPLSPLLFNAIVDPLLEHLDSRRDKGISINGTMISVLAFADDLILLGRDRRDAEEDLKTVGNYFQTLGMTLSIPKCCAFQIRTARKTWYIEDPRLAINNELVQYIGPDRTFRYLGIDFTPWGGISGGAACQEFVKSCGRVKTLPLKPQQKQRLMFEYLYPRYRYAMVIDMPTVTSLRQADNLIRQIVRSNYHLSDCVTERFFYTRKRDGGLGIPRLETDVQFGVLKNVANLGHSVDLVLRELSVSSLKAEQANKAARNLRVAHGMSPKEIDAAKQRAINREFEEWSRLSCQGEGLRYFKNNEVSNRWLKYDLLQPNRMIDAIKMRTNTHGNRTSLRRAGSDHLSHLCRRCGLRPETLSHVLNGCHMQKACVIRRHNEVGTVVTDKYAEVHPAATIIKEPTFRTADNRLLKPDLVIKNQERVFIVDFTVRYENGNSLEEASVEKKTKYDDIKNAVLERMGGETCKVLAIVIGSRGAIPSDTLRALKELSIKDKSLLLTLSLIALRSSTETANAFMDL